MRTALVAAVAALVSLAQVSLAQELDVPPGGFAISGDLSLLPTEVREQREALLAIARTGDISALTPILDANRTTVSFGDPDDRTESLVRASADGEGIEILAILADILEAPYAAIDAGEAEPIYVWPSVAALDNMSELAPDQLVEAYQVAGHAAVQQMKEIDAWYYWRVHIGADGTLLAFVAGD